MISVIIPVRDRENPRIKRCVDSFKKWVEEIILVDYGSKKPIVCKDAKVIRYTKSKVWNKAHAINLGLKAANPDNYFIMTVDVDMILDDGIMKKILYYITLKQKVFIYNTNVRRIEIKDIPHWEKSKDWFPNASRSNIYSKANGGVQVFPRKWIYAINGFDENLVYWGGIDNDIYERAFMNGLDLINLNKPMYHQEHKFHKEENLKGLDEQRLANYIRSQKINYLNEKLMKRKIKGPDKWGLQKPNQTMFIYSKKEWEKIKADAKISDKDEFLKKVVDNLKAQKKYIERKGVVYNVFSPKTESKNGKKGNK